MSAPKKIVLASTAQIYGGAVYPDEQVSRHPLNDYAVSKLSMEYMAALWLEYLPIVIARPFNCIGIGQSPNFVVSKILQNFIVKNDIIELGNTQIERDFIDIRQAAADYYSLALNGEAGEAYNIASGEGTSISRLLELFAQISNHDIEVRCNPQFIRENDPSSIRGNIEKISGISENRPKADLKNTLSWMYEDACRR